MQTHYAPSPALSGAPFWDSLSAGAPAAAKAAHAARPPWSVDRPPAAEKARPGRRPHVLDVSMFWGPAGGVRRVLGAKHQHLPALGWRHSILAPSAQTGADPDLNDCGGVTLPHTGGYRAVLSRAGAADTMVRLAPDVIESADPYTLAWATLDAGQRLGVPTVAFCHSHLPLLAARLIGGRSGLATWRGLWAARHARSYLKRLYSRFDRVLAPSRALARTLIDWGVQRVEYQPLGVDCSVFTPQGQDEIWRRELAQRLGLDSGTRLLIYCGRFAPEKNLDLLAEAVRLLGPRYALLAVGAGPCPPRGERVFVLPPDTDPLRLARTLASCDLFVHAGDQETFGLAALEAMACGTPLVVSAAGGLGELAKGAARLVESARAIDWAHAIADSLREPSSAQVWAGLERARAHDCVQVTEQMARRYAGLLLEHPGRQPAAPAAARRPDRTGSVGAVPV